MHLVDLVDTFIETLGFALDVLFLPVLGSLLAYLKLNFKRVELFDDLLVRSCSVILISGSGSALTS